MRGINNVPNSLCKRWLGHGILWFPCACIYLLSGFGASCTLVRLCVDYWQLCSYCYSAWDLCFPRWPLIVRKKTFPFAAGKMEHISVPWLEGRNPSRQKTENPP